MFVGTLRSMASDVVPQFATADLYDTHAERVEVSELEWISVGQRRRFAGPIETLKAFEDNSLVREILGEPGRGRVLVVDAGGSRRRAMLGDQLAQRAVDAGWAGVVIWGCIRDRVAIDAMALGVRCIGTTPRKTEKRGEGQRGIRLQFGGARFEPGAWLYADEDGILVSPLSLS